MGGPIDSKVYCPRYASFYGIPVDGDGVVSDIESFVMRLSNLGRRIHSEFRVCLGIVSATTAINVYILECIILQV